ncbi:MULTISPECIES: tape measure protein [unclassified Pantoea]|uniref:tape measure protein n=1 Tax=unclassified Pantoea TaxID=2630326 RepID=UPI00226ABFB7|nr:MULTISPECIES: tape measure protein [unclassified Pantoea]
MAEKVGEIYYEVGADIAPLLQGSSQANDALDAMGKVADKASGNMDGLERSAQKTGKAVARAADDASQAAKIMERLGNEIAVLEEANQNGARSATVLAAQLMAAGDASEAQTKEIGNLAGKLFDVKSASLESAKSLAANTAAIQRAQSAISSLESDVSVLSTEMESGSRSAAILAAQLKAGEGATQDQKNRIGELTGKLYDMKAAQDASARATMLASKQAAQQANDAAKLRSLSSNLTQQIALLNEEQKNGARSAAMLAARLQAGSTATAAQRREIGELAGKLYDLKQAQDQANASQQKSAGIMGGLKTGLSAIASAIAISQVVEYGKQFLEVADAMTQLQARIDRLSPSAKEGAATFQALASIASASGASLKDTEKLWETLTSSLQNAGATNGQILALTDTLQKIGRIGGSSSEEMANALRQFGQSIAGGTVRAEEFNSIIEQMPELARQMAAGLGLSVGELRKRMLEGKLSAEDALNAIMSQTGKVNAEFSRLPRTVDQATNSLSISFQEMIKQINDATGASTGMVHVIDSITAAIDRLSGKVPTVTQQIADLNSTAEMFSRRAKTYSMLGLDGWAAQAEGINVVSNKAAALVSDLAAVTKANTTAANTGPIKVGGTGDSKEVEKLEKSTKRKLELSKLEGEARARLQAQYDAEDAGIKDNGRIKALQDEYAATERNTSARKTSTAEGKKAASQAESVSQKLTSLKQQSELAASSTQQLSREQALLRAEQSLGKGATSEQIQQARDYAAAVWDTAAAIKARNAIPELKENADYAAQKSQLEMLKSAKDAQGNLLISQQQYNTTSEQLEQDHQTKLAQIRAGQAVTPQQQAAGSVDPVQALANENAQKLALIQQFTQQRILTEQQGLELMNAANTEYEQQRIAAQWEIYKNQSAANSLLADAVDSLQGGATNAITGLLNGTQSLSEAFANIGTTILGSVVSGLVEMGLQYVKNMLMGQAAAAASLAATAAQATAAASAWAPAAISASIATMGTASSVGTTAYSTALLASKGLAIAGAREHGGPVNASSMYRVGEGGKPEIFKASNGSQYMIPGDSGKVISNSDLGSAGSEGGGTVFNVAFNIQTTNGIDDATMQKMAGMMKQVALYQIKDQSTRPGGMLQPRK